MLGLPTAFFSGVLIIMLLSGAGCCPVMVRQKRSRYSQWKAASVKQNSILKNYYVLLPALFLKGQGKIENNFSLPIKVSYV